MFRRAVLLHNFVGVRQLATKITQIDTLKSLSKADRIKKLNYESKHLFGSTVKRKKQQVKEPATELADDSKNSKHDISSEIYWTCLHVPEVQDFTKPSKKGKKSKSSKAQAKADEKAPESLEASAEDSDEFSDAFPLQKPSKKIAEGDQIEQEQIKSSFDIVFKTESVDSSHEQEIPFLKEQLRAITNFPLALSSSKTINAFETLKPSSIYLPSVSKILQATMPEAQRAALIQWKNQKIVELGLEGFELMQQSNLSRGKDFHGCLQTYFKGEAVDKLELSSDAAAIWNSIEPLLASFQTPALLVEQKIEHPYLKYQGIVDCVGFHNSSLCVIEWKRSEKQKKQLSFTYDAPIQLCSYLGALNASREEFKENPIKGGVVVVAYSDGRKADLFELSEGDLKKHWKLWLHRLQEYWVRYKDNTLPEKI